jgi:spore germination protein GerM
MSRIRMLRGLTTAALAVAVCATAALAGGGAAVASAALSPAASVGASRSTPTTAGVRLYFLRADGTLIPAYRVVTVRGQAIATAAVTALLQGTTAAERAAGLTSAVPAGTRLRGITVASGTATVDLTGRYASGGGSLSMTGRLGQLVYTLTQFPTVQRVALRLDGHRVTVLGGEGVIVGRTATRAQFTSLLPPIFIDSPALGQSVTSPVRVSGVANVFEGQFQVDVRDAAGKVLARASATAATVRDRAFSVTLSYAVARTQAGSVVGFDRSAKDGAVIDVVRVPVTLRSTDLADGRYPVLVKSVDAAHRTMLVDVVEFFTGAAAARAAAQDHAPDVPPPNDYWIRNSSTQLRRLPIAPGAVITVNTLGASWSGSAVKNVRVTLSRLAALKGLDGSLFWITLDHGQVTRIAQQYLP